MLLQPAACFNNALEVTDPSEKGYKEMRASITAARSVADSCHSAAFSG